ncbi:hypothetical protein NA56DRAFT_203346 [Hyaloscypha hepaticicola]|uniref:Uncharacterized protein n=1 Tax=Hyaloscypha hepaticicola TaxID=2082293 RepID=A0A2J6Q001_9HELO|nr:hypothetical protein NA56DRAFT_203346 [Hyaloscypha hepaticicola]
MSNSAALKCVKFEVKFGHQILTRLKSRSKDLSPTRPSPPADIMRAIVATPKQRWQPTK